MSKTGRPLKYSKQELQQKIEEYFNLCMKGKKNCLKAELRQHLNITKETWSEWRNNKKKGFSDLIKKADDRFEIEGWKKLMIADGSQVTARIFYLKCLGIKEIETEDNKQTQMPQITINTK